MIVTKFASVKTRAALAALGMAMQPAFAQQVILPSGAFKILEQDFDRGTYGAINLQFKNFAPALKRAEEHAGASLRHRGEAHLTVLTPPEYIRLDAKLRKKILSEMKSAVQDLKPVCIGRGQAEVQGKTEAAYFIVMEAKGIAAVREKYHLTDFYPHVTLGFTKRDLHFEDGVKKDKTTCVADAALAPKSGLSDQP